MITAMLTSVLVAAVRCRTIALRTCLILPEPCSDRSSYYMIDPTQFRLLIVAHRQLMYLTLFFIVAGGDVHRPLPTMQPCYQPGI
jgi:hypothetical protein